MEERIAITILVNNQVGKGLVSEHGFALWIEIGDTHILYDTGEGGALIPNAQSLGIDLSQTDVLVLSHGHYDHTGGLVDVLSRAQRAHVYCHPSVMLDRYSIHSGRTRAVGIAPASARALRSVPPERMTWVTRQTVLSRHGSSEDSETLTGIGVTGPIARESVFEDTGGPFYLDVDATRVDALDDDLAVWIRKEDGIIACVGCAHAGIVNTLAQIERLSGGTYLKAAIGGFHLINASEERIERTVVALESFSPEKLIPCHCTGDRATTFMAQALGNRVVPGSAGDTYLF